MVIWRRFEMHDTVDAVDDGIDGFDWDQMDLIGIR